MLAPPEVIVAGHVCLDLIPRFIDEPEVVPGRLSDVGPLTIRPGGCVANTGLDLDALGTSVRLAAAVGDDLAGRLLIDLLDQSDADIAGVEIVGDVDTSYSVVVEPPGGDRSFWHHVGANARFDGDAVSLDGARFVHIGYPAALPTMHANGGEALVALLERCRASGATTSLDLSTFAPGSAAAAEDWPVLIDRVLPVTDLFSASASDLRCALGIEPSVEQASALAVEFVRRGAAAVLLKVGAGGLHLVTAGSERLAQAGAGMCDLDGTWSDLRLHAPSKPVDIVSTTGAGDAAVAGLLHAMSLAIDPHLALWTAASAAAARIGSHGRLPDWDSLVRVPHASAVDNALHQRSDNDRIEIG